MVKNLPTSAGDSRNTGSIPWVRKIPWSSKWQPAPVILSGKFHGQSSLAGYSPRGLQRVRHDWAHIYTHTHIHRVLKYVVLINSTPIKKIIWLYQVLVAPSGSLLLPTGAFLGVHKLSSCVTEAPESANLSSCTHGFSCSKACEIFVP